MQLTHYNSKFQPRSFPICLICDGLTSPYNIGGMFRIADAFGIEQLYFINSNQNLGNKYKRTSRSAEKHVSYELANNFESIYHDLKSKDYQFIVLEITEHSMPLSSSYLDYNKPVALIIGSENSGVSDGILEKIPKHLHIEMYGVNSSMNVVQSTAIALYELTNRFK
ncbi:TrmH family RNA methyltransferase [Winogradskyella aurantiaca]|uniref:TrmH family RNA methyltransferase n=1 Tax=Winogradskyella aurantiaca TaxID=2219558 RepID=UPI000E1C61AC|nr:TrmH family RNA methyltransferase [Winogradskyella aurantiaca]